MDTEFELWLNDQPVRSQTDKLPLFLQQHGIEGAFVLALNAQYLPRSDWPSVCLQPGDRLELLRPIAGG